jgi:hypothetical protein
MEIVMTKVEEWQARKAGDPNKAPGEAIPLGGRAKPWDRKEESEKPATRALDAAARWVAWSRIPPFSFQWVDHPLRGFARFCHRLPGFRAPAKRDRFTLGFIRVARAAGLRTV